VQTRASNGGIISLNELVARVRSSGSACRSKATPEDIKRSIKKISILGDGFKLVDVGGTCYITSLPMELSTDHLELINICREESFVSETLLHTRRGWSQHRFDAAINYLLREEIIWKDDNNGNPR
jgi:ESCRT-II complex subunit VPS22